ncbi:MAG: MFS transporter [Gammaproteobacteria bacterium]|nr:MAG: MFS transporter [Gammaproteobacteria bacterium]
MTIASLPLIGRILRGPALRHRDFRLLLGAATCNYVGWGGEQVIIGLLVFRLTGSSAWVGVALALYFLPLLIFGMAAGAIADWIDRRRLLRIIEAVIGINLVVFGVLAGLEAVSLWQVLLVTFVSGSARAMYLPVRQSYAYDIVGAEHVVAGLGVLNIGLRAGQLIGALVAGSAMQRLGTDYALFTLAAAHGIAFLIISRLRSIATAAHDNPVSIWENLREYVQEMRRNRVLLMLILVTAAVEVLGFSFATILPELATGKLGVGAEGLGIMHAVRAAGGFAAGIVLAGTSSFRRRGFAYLIVIYAFGFALIALAVAPGFTTILAAVLAVAALSTASDVLTQSMMQLSVPDRLRGRAMGAWVFAIGAAPLGHLEIGALAASVGVGAALGVNGIGLILIGILTTIMAPGLRKL